MHRRTHRLAYEELSKSSETITAIGLHGILSNKKYFIALADCLDTKFISIDLLGFGNSPKPNVGYEIDAIIRDLHDTIKSSAGADTIDIIGHSLGGLYGIFYAEANSDKVRNLFIIGSPIEHNRHNARKTLKRISSLNYYFAFGRHGETVHSFLFRLTPIGVLLGRRSMDRRGIDAVVSEGVGNHTFNSLRQTIHTIIDSSSKIEGAIVNAMNSGVQVTYIYGELDEWVSESGRKILHRLESRGMKLVSISHANHELPQTHAKELSAIISSLQN